MLLGVLALAALAAGCGSSEPDPLTKAAFIKQGNSICRQEGEEREAALKEAAKESAQEPEGSSSEAELESFVVDVALPPIQAMTDELDDLGVPARDEKQVDAIIDGFEEGVENSEADPRGAVSGAPFTDAVKRAEAYGLTDCTI